MRQWVRIMMSEFWKENIITNLIMLVICNMCKIKNINAIQSMNIINKKCAIYSIEIDEELLSKNN